MTYPFQGDIHRKDRISIIQKQEFLPSERKDSLYYGAMEINKWIASARKSAGITQDQLSEALGVTRGNVSGWETGRHEPSWSQILKICEITRSRPPISLPVDFSEDVVKSSVSSKADSSLHDFVRLAQLYEASTDKGRRRILDSAEAAEKIDRLGGAAGNQN